MILGNEFIFETLDDAVMVQRKLDEIMNEKGFVTCYRLYKMLGFLDEDKIYPDIYYNHGWASLWGSRVERIDNCVNGKWILKMPQIKRLNVKEND